MTARKATGKTFILATAGVAVLAWAGITFLPTDSVDAKVDKPQHSSGTLACVGFYNSDKNQKFRWIFTNQNAETITIDRFRVYDYAGTLVWDSDVNGSGLVPADQYGHLGSDNQLEGYQTAWYKSEPLEGAGVLPSSSGSHVKVHVVWSAASNVDPLAGVTVRHVVVNTELGPALGRSTSPCRDI
ncbi:MAG: hypothetical protein PVH46_02935 [Granulosicoccaceae bacterium]|jgi:hypothetical protein